MAERELFFSSTAEGLTALHVLVKSKGTSPEQLGDFLSRMRALSAGFGMGLGRGGKKSDVDPELRFMLLSQDRHGLSPLVTALDASKTKMAVKLIEYVLEVEPEEELPSGGAKAGALPGALPPRGLLEGFFGATLGDCQTGVLHIALRKKAWKVAVDLLSAPSGAVALNARDEVGVRPVVRAIIQNARADFVEKMVERGAEFVERDAVSRG